MRRAWKRIYWAVYELIGELEYARSWRERRSVLRTWRCGRGLHWPIRWSEYAYPGSWDPPEPPEPGFACDWCGHEREPYRAWWWDVKAWWYYRRVRSQRRVV